MTRNCKIIKGVILKKIVLPIAIILAISNIRTNGQIASFETVDCLARAQDTISSRLILFANGSFVINQKSGSILQPKIPQEVGMERFDTKKSAQIVLQKIPTEDIGKIQLDMPKPKPTWIFILSILACGLMGGVFALIYKKGLFIGSVLGCAVGFLIVFLSGGGERVSITFDNSNPIKLAIHLENVNDSIILPKLSQVTVSMPEGEKLFTIRNSEGDTLIDSVRINFFSDSINGKLVYNIKSNNSYILIDGVYQKE